MKRYEIESDDVQDIPVVGVVGEGGRVYSSLSARSPSELPHVYEEGIIPPENDEFYTAPVWVGVLCIWAMLVVIVGLVLLARWLA